MQEKKIELYTPLDHQRIVHDAITKHINSYDRFSSEFQKIFCIKAMRQVGKSACAASELLRFGFGFNNSINGYVAPTLKLSRKTFKELVSITPLKLLKHKSQMDLSVEFVNGSKINFYSAEQRDGLRGFNVSGLLVVDEAAFVQDSIYYECLSPWVDFYKAVMLVISTPKFRFGFFHDLYHMGLTNNSNVQSFDWSSYDMTSIRSNEALEQKRITLPAQQFNCEYLGRWADGVGNVFSGFEYINHAPDFECLYLGLDFGTGANQDSTVLTGINENGEQCLLWETNSIEPVKQVEEITKIIQQHKSKIKKFNAEKNSIGKVYIDMLRKSNPGIVITEFNTDNESKRKLVENMQVSFEQSRIKLLANDMQSTQLSFYEATVNPSTNKVSYNASKGFHDDYVMALMLANHSFINRNNNPRISIY